MAVRELYGLAVGNIEVDTTNANQKIHAGMIIARNASTGKAVPANRADAATAPAIGVAADDATRLDNTMIQADPVGATSLVSGELVANNNGFFAATKRALGDYQDESVSNVSDLVSGSTGYQGPRRGIGYFSTPSTQLIIDGSVIYYKSTTNNAGGAADDVDSAWTINDYLTCATGTTNYGKWVKVSASDTTSKKIARIDKIDGTLGTSGALVYITLL